MMNGKHMSICMEARMNLKIIQTNHWRTVINYSKHKINDFI